MTVERRSYFRVQDIALVKYRAIPRDELDNEQRLVYFNEVKLDNLRAAWAGIESQIQVLHAELPTEAGAVSQLIDLLNRKLNLLERVVSLETAPHDLGQHDEHALQEINLSAGGMALFAESPLEQATCLAIDLILLPEHDVMRLFGEVVTCRERDSRYEIAIEFRNLREEDRDLLVQHVLRVQTNDLRNTRAQAEPPSLASQESV